MKRILTLLAAGACAAALAGLNSAAQAAPDMSLTRLGLRHAAAADRRQ